MDFCSGVDRVYRYNAEGVAGLSDRHGDFGPKRFLLLAQEGELAGWVLLDGGDAGVAVERH